MKLPSTSLVSSMVITLACIQTSCGNLGAQAGLRIHDLESGKNILIEAGGYREVVCSEVSPLKAFYTISREADSLVIKKRDQNGIEMQRSKLPLLASIWFGPHWCAISPSGTYLAYLDEKSKRMRIRNLSTGDDQKLGAVHIESDTSITLMRWISESTVAVAVYGQPGNHSRGTTIYRISLGNGVAKKTSVAYDDFPFPTISPNGSLICGVVDSIGNGKIVIRDTANLQVSHKVPQIREGQFISGVGWSADSRQVLFILESGKKQSLHIYDLGTKKLEQGPSLPGSSMIIRGSLGKTIAASGEATSKNVAWVFDAAKGTWRRAGTTNGGIHGIRGTNRYVITE